MRPTETFHRLKALTSSFRKHLSYQNSEHKVLKLKELRQHLEFAQRIPIVAEYASKILDSEALGVVGRDSVTVPYAEYVALSESAQMIDVTRLAAISMLSLHSDETDLSFYVKLGEANDLASVSRVLGRLDQIFNQTLSVVDHAGPTKVKSWETGSLWINMLAGSASAVILIGGLAWVAACALRKYQEGLAMAEIVAGLKTKNKMLNSISEAFEDDINAMIDAEVSRLDQTHSTRKGDPETISRLRNAAKDLFDMMKSGTEIHPALSAPETIKNVFPDFLSLPEAKKLLLKQDAEDVA